MFLIQSLTNIFNMSIPRVKIKKLPDSPGVYFFQGARKKILYIGKATSIRDRVRSYLNTDITQSRGPLIHEMLAQVKSIDYIRTDSVLEALILEVNLIKKHQPIYNTKEKSDKSFNYVVITSEDFPRILLVRQREIDVRKFKEKIKYMFGPFPEAGSLKEALRIVRKIFPFRDTCTPLQHSNILQNVGMLSVKGEKKQSPVGISCFNRQIGLCPGVCTGEISKKEYQKTIQNIKLLFEGKKNTLVKKLMKEMKEEAKKNEFELAAHLRNTIFSLKHIQDIALIKSTSSLFQSSQELWNKQKRIEGYDVAHFSGMDTVGVMVVIEEGVPNKNGYRKFNIKNIKKKSDTHALAEIIERRLGHTEWQLPKIIVVDGGKAQVNTANRILKKYDIQIPVVGVVKDEHHRPKNILGDKGIVQQNEKGILLANSEAHRFAITFHRKKRILQACLNRQGLSL